MEIKNKTDGNEMFVFHKKNERYDLKNNLKFFYQIVNLNVCNVTPSDVFQLSSSLF